jgi:NAD(P)H-quinone oxidoreductase subunit K
MKGVEPILTGKYIQSAERATPPKELMEAMGMPVPPALLTAEKEVERRG